MELVVVTPPEPFLTIDEAKAHIRAGDFTDDDLLIDGYVAAACSAIDGPNGWINRAIGEQTVRLYLDAFPASCDMPLRLPLPRVSAITALGYVDGDGADQVMDEDDYRLIWPDTDRASLDLAYGGSWPSARSQSSAVSITYTAGYSGAVPAAIKQAALLLIGHWYSNRETVVVGQTPSEMPMATQALLNPYRVFV